MTSDGFEIDRLSLEVPNDSGDVIDVIAVPDDPNIIGFDAPEGSLGLSQSGKAYRKVGPLATEWGAGAATNGGGGTTLESFVPFCLANGASSNIELVVGEVPFRLASGTFDNIELVI